MITPSQPDSLLSARAPGLAAVLPSWRQVHSLLAERAKNASGMGELAGISIYYHGVYKAFGQHWDAKTAQRQLAQLATQLARQPVGAWLPRYFDHARAVAWLSGRLEADGLAVPEAQRLLASLDQELQQQAQHWQRQPEALTRPDFFRAIRYFGLRRPAPVAEEALQLLLAGPLLAGPALRWPPSAQPLSLGLADGLAAELLALMEVVPAAGLPQAQPLRRYVREGVQQVLALKRDLDFQGRHYALFPYQVHAETLEPTFSAELTWRRGDMGQALLLYGASELFADAELARIAELVGLSTLLRTTGPTTRVVGAGFERGAAGVAHLYHRLYRASGHLPKYYQGYLFWLGETQRWLSQELAAGLYRQREADLPEGLAGIGLVLLAAATGTGHDWDRLLV